MGKIITMPDFLKYRYTPRTGSWLSIITLIAYILTKVSVTAYTGGIFLEFLLGLPFWYGAIGLIVLTGIFTVLSGMKGVMTLSAIQTPILIIGSFLVLFLGLSALGDGNIATGWTEMMDHARSAMNVGAADTLMVPTICFTGPKQTRCIKIILDSGYLSELPSSVSGIGVPTSISYSVYLDSVKAKIMMW